jgi:hypothetical protein
VTPVKRSPLRQVLEREGCSLKDVTVLAPQNDPFRVDTPARHRDGEWLAVTAEALGLGTRRIHLRGLHYMVLGRPKPNGQPYTNTETDWLWLSEDCGKAARWLGYLPFDQIIDQRNAPPEVRPWEPPQPLAYLSVGVDVDIPDADDLTPEVGVDGFAGSQPFKLVIFGEKSSLGDVLRPVAQTFKADLYLPTGEISDTLMYQMTRVGAADGRPMVVLCFADCDPAGWQMPISIGRKLQAFRTLGFPELEFEVHRAALTPDQVREYGLPSMPLRDTERRGDKWRGAMGVEQTEIDALASLQPDLLRRVAQDALDPYFDSTLDLRVYEAEQEWLTEAQMALDAATDSAQLDWIRREAAQRLDALRDEIDALNAAMQIDPGGIELPELVIPETVVDGTDAPTPLLDSRWPFAEQCRRLIDSKAYR